MRKLRKALSVPGLLAITRNRFRRVPDHRGGESVDCTVRCVDVGVAVFGLKCPSKTDKGIGGQGEMGYPHRLGQMEQISVRPVSVVFCAVAVCVATGVEGRH